LTMGLKWDQAEELAEVLAENHPGLNPLDARFTDLRQWVIDLDEFDDSREGSTEGKLEAIQMAWHEIYKEQNEDDSE
jgi:FeS assembly protein IscX